MKDLRIPEKSDNFVDLATIDIDFNGIIIGYKDNNAVGYIQRTLDYWCFLYDIHCESISHEEPALTDLVMNLIKECTCDSFKVIEFQNKYC